ncbi:MAG: hypothetical protein JOZ65_18020, partial [Chloroflexi bacterium]|nr:hypothetical protein [Chloroflexota bacterium]
HGVALAAGPGAEVDAQRRIVAADQYFGAHGHTLERVLDQQVPAAIEA